MQRLRLIIIVSLAAILLGAGVAVYLHEPAKLPTMEDGEDLPSGQQGQPRMKGVTYTHVEDGLRKWSLSASRATHDPKEGKLMLTDVQMAFYPAKGGKITLRGDTGEYFQEKKIVILTGNVVGTTHDGVKLLTDRLVYSEPDQTVDTDSWVNISGDRFEVQGKGMFVRIKDNHFTLKTQVDSTFIPTGGGPPAGATVE